MAQNISLWGATYSNVPSVKLPKQGGGTASFTDVTDTTATATDVASGKYFYSANGTKTQGTASGGTSTDFVVTLTYEYNETIEDYVWTPDETIEEIQDAYSDGLNIVAIADRDSYEDITHEYPAFISVGCNYNPNYGAFTYEVAVWRTGGSYEISSYSYTGAGVSLSTDLEYINPNFQTKTVNPTTSQQLIEPDAYYNGLESVTVNAMPTGTAGTPVATKGTVSNHSVTVTPSVTNTTGYITGSTKTGTAVTVTASELISFVTYYTGSSAPSSSLGSNGDIYLQTT